MIAEVSVIPDSKKFSILLSKDGRLKISLKSPPENNRANLELIRALSRVLGKEVRMLSGHASKKKRLLIDITPEDWNAFLSRLRQPL